MTPLPRRALFAAALVAPIAAHAQVTAGDLTVLQPWTRAVRTSSVVRRRLTAPTEKYSSPRRNTVLPARRSSDAREINSTNIA